MAVLSKDEVNKLLSELRQETSQREQYFNVQGDNYSVRSIGGLSSGQTMGGSGPSVNAGGQVSGFAAMTAILTGIAQDMRTVAQIMMGSGGAGGGGFGGPIPLVNNAQARNNMQSSPLNNQTTWKVDASGHVIAPPVDGQNSYMSKVFDRASYQGGLQPHALAWDIIGQGSSWGRSQLNQGSSLISQGNALYDQGAAIRSTPAGWDMMEQGRAISAAGSGMLPLGRAALGASAFAGAALFVGMEAQKAWMAQTQPLHELNVQVTKAEAAGQYVDTMQRGLLRQAQGLQGSLDASRSWGGLIDWLPVVGAERMHGYRMQELDIARVQGQAESVMTRKAIGAFSSDANRAYINSYDYNGTLEVSQGLSRTLRQFGSGVTDTISTGAETGYLRGLLSQGFTPGDIIDPIERSRAIASAPGGAAMKAFLESQIDSPEQDRINAGLKSRSVDLKNKIKNNRAWLRGHNFGVDTDDVKSMQAELDHIESQIGGGAVRTQAKLRNQMEYDADAGRIDLVGNNPERSQAAMDRASSQLGYASTGLEASYEMQKTSGTIRRLSAQGASAETTNIARSEFARHADIRAAAARSFLSGVNVDPQLRKKAEIELAQAEAEGPEAIRASTLAQNQQDSMILQAAEQTAQIATTRGLYGPGGSIGGYVSGMGGQAAAAGATAANLRQQAARPGIDPGYQASLLAQAAQKEMERDVLLPRETSMMQIGAVQSEYQSRLSNVQVGIAERRARGVGAGDAGFGEQATLQGQMAANEDAMANLPGLSPWERQQHRAAARRSRYEQSVLTPNEEAQAVLGEGMAAAGVTSARAGRSMSAALLTGGAAEYGKAVTESLKGLKEALDAVTKRINDADSGKAPFVNAQARSEALQTQAEYDRKIYEAQIEEKRGPSRIASEIAGSRQSEAGFVAAKAFGTGIGGSVGMGYSLRNVQAAKDVLDAKKNELAIIAQDSGPNSQAYRNKAAEVAAADYGVTQSQNEAAANTPLPVGMRSRESAGAFNLQVLTSTYTPFGNVRGALANQMGIYGQELRELNRMEAQQRASGNLNPEAAFGFQQRRQEIGGKLIGAQQQYEQGFMDRIIAATYNAPASFKGVASQFTMREAAPFMQAMGTHWGFTDANQRDAMMFRYPRLANSITGMPGSEGFIAAAMGGQGGRYGASGGGSIGSTVVGSFPGAGSASGGMHMVGGHMTDPHMVGGHMEGGHLVSEYIGHGQTRSTMIGGHLVGGHMEPGHMEGGHLVRDNVVPGGGVLKGGGSLGVQTIRVIVEVHEKGTKIGVSDSTHVLSNVQNNLTISTPTMRRAGASQ